MRGLCVRQREEEPSAGRPVALGPDPAAMIANDLGYDRQPQSRALELAIGAGAAKGLEDELPELWIEADAVVCHEIRVLGFALPAADLDARRFARARELRGVVEEIAEHGHQELGV